MSSINLSFSLNQLSTVKHRNLDFCFSLLKWVSAKGGWLLSYFFLFIRVEKRLSPSTISTQHGFHISCHPVKPHTVITSWHSSPVSCNFTRGKELAHVTCLIKMAFFLACLACIGCFWACVQPHKFFFNVEFIFIIKYHVGDNHSECFSLLFFFFFVFVFVEVLFQKFISEFPCLRWESSMLILWCVNFVSTF